MNLKGSRSNNRNAWHGDFSKMKQCNSRKKRSFKTTAYPPMAYTTNKYLYFFIFKHKTLKRMIAFCDAQGYKPAFGDIKKKAHP